MVLTICSNRNWKKESVFTIVLPPQLVGVGGDDAVNDVGSYEDDEDKDDNRNYDNKNDDN